MHAIQELDQWLEQQAASPDARYLAQLAVEELGTNIIKYGYDDAHEHSIRLSASCSPETFNICLEDDGHEFNPCTTPDPDINVEDREPGGLGLCLIRKMSAGMDYERRNGQNVVCVRIYRRSATA